MGADRDSSEILAGYFAIALVNVLEAIDWPEAPGTATDVEQEGPSIINIRRRAGQLVAAAAALLTTWIGLTLVVRAARHRRRRRGEQARSMLATQLPQLAAVLAATSRRSDPAFLPTSPAQHPFVVVARPWSDDARVAAWERLSNRYEAHVTALHRASATYIELRARPVDALRPADDLEAQRRVEGAPSDASAAAEFARSIEGFWRPRT